LYPVDSPAAYRVPFDVRGKINFVSHWRADESVALWFDADGIPTSDLGTVESTVIVAQRNNHCPARPTCRILPSRPGGRVLLTRELLGTLIDDWAAAPSEALGARVGRIAVDHVGNRGGGQWV
jgi:hypothetical protein